MGVKDIWKFIKSLPKEIVVEIISIAILAILSYIFRDYVNNFLIILNILLPLWIVFLIIFLILILTSLFNYINKPRSRIEFLSPKGRGYKEEEHTCKFCNVDWIYYIPIQEAFDETLGRTQEYVRVEGPFCPNCKTSLQVKKVGILRMKKWFCIPCNKYFNRPQKEDENTIKSLLEDMLCARTYRKDKFKS